MAHNISGKDLRELGYPEGKAIGAAMVQLARKENKHVNRAVLLETLKKVLEAPGEYLVDLQWSHTAAALIPAKDRHIELRETALPFKVWGEEGIEQGAMQQMYTAMKLPVTVAGALMPDAHLGYGLPIGGVLATENSIIPYCVGVDIGCRMALSVFPIGEDYMNQRKQEFASIIRDSSRFGGRFEKFKTFMDHEVLDRTEFKNVPFLKNKLDTAVAQIGTSGGGNHFVEFGVVDITEETPALGLAVGKYVALLTHSGSRGLGASIAKHYTDLAMEQCMLPDPAKHLAYLSLDSETGMEYWIAMNLAGDYASACHRVAMWFKDRPHKTLVSLVVGVLSLAEGLAIVGTIGFCSPSWVLDFYWWEAEAATRRNQLDRPEPWYLKF